MTRRRLVGRPLRNPPDDPPCPACHRCPSLRSASLTYRCGYAFVGGPCEERRCRRMTRRRLVGRPLRNPPDDPPCPACHRCPSLRSISLTYRCGYAFVGGPCEERRCRRMTRRRLVGRPLRNPPDDPPCPACHRRRSLCSISLTYRCGYAFVGGPCEERRCRRMTRRRLVGRPLRNPPDDPPCPACHRCPSLRSISLTYRARGSGWFGGRRPD